MNENNRILRFLKFLAASIRPATPRVARALQEQLSRIGRVIEGSICYRELCPKGAGFGPRTHSMEERTSVGSRGFARRQRRFVRDLMYHPWGRAVTGGRRRK